MTVAIEVLKAMAEEVVSMLANDPELALSIALEDYHGFEKGQLPAELLGHVASSHGASAVDVQAELVFVQSDLSDEVHSHEHAHAYCIVLGSESGFSGPHRGHAYLRDAWKPVSEGDVVDIPPGTKHGFTVDEGGSLYFLSLQSPPIERDGEDDYVREEVNEKPF